MVLVGTGWRIERRALALLLAVFLAAGSLLAGRAGTGRSAADLVSVIVRAVDVRDARAAVESNGGTVSDELHLVDAVVGRVPADHLGAVRATPGVVEVAPNAPVRVQGISAPHAASDVFNEVTGASQLRSEGIDGDGVTVAVVDTGIQADLPDLAGRVVGGVDFSGENNAYRDSFGHGTFVAGLIAGNGSSSNGQYTGVAPRTKLVSVKIAGRSGASDVGHVLAAMQWLVTYKDRYGIKVANLSFGTDSDQHYYASLLNFAVERVWDSGITVVVSASNLGPSRGSITKPADDPLVITVGAMDDRGTVGRGDDVMAGFSGQGPTASDGIEKPDLVASGRSVVSLRVPGSYIDEAAPSGRVGTSNFRGSGTSFSTAITSGAVALLLQNEPWLTPNQIKHRLLSTAAPAPDPNPNVAGKGSLDVYAAAHAGTTTEANQGVVRSIGNGSIEADRGGFHVEAVYFLPGLLRDLIRTVTQLTGSLLPNLRTFDANQYVGTVWNEANWVISQWTGADFRTVQWSGSSWWGSSWWGSSWWGSSWWGSSWWGSSWWGSSWWWASMYAASWD